MLKLFKDNPLFIVFVIPIIVDILGTVLGQPPEYWTTSGQIYNEAVPFLDLLLQINPLLFITFCLIFWLTFTYWLVKKLKNPLDVWAAMALLIGHGYNSVHWLRIDLYRAGLFTGSDQFSQLLSLIPMTIYILLIGWIASYGVDKYYKLKN